MPMHYIILVLYSDDIFLCFYSYRDTSKSRQCDGGEKSTIPSCWNVRKYDIEIIRDEKLFLEMKNVNAGNQADIHVNPKVYSAVARNIQFAENIRVG